MSPRRPADSERLERYLDGLSSAAERGELERELARDPALAAEVALARRIDAALGRQFAPPARSGALPVAERAAPKMSAPVGDRRMWLAAAGIAFALALGLALLRRGTEHGPQQLALAPRPGVAPATLATPVAEAEAPAPAVDPHGLPDVASLYARLSVLPPRSADGPGALGAPPGSSRGLALDLSSELAERYDACLDVGTPACSLLGPYAAPEWPSATVLVGYCEGGDRTPSLLVVDDQTLKGCAMAPDTGALSPFYKEVNGLAVWEISPRGEPLLLDAVRSCRE